ncbi:MAG: hypothetical protein GWN07_33970, partial [Actinobacteria bacterium]|nr:hypothetical protein [Actinomycetota bacterium]NIX24545.1 hypothetical protein [Actinomycetota bacterium]
VGTVDITSGIDVMSLSVCILDDADACADDLSVPAEPHGVVEIPLASPLTDAD